MPFLGEMATRTSIFLLIIKENISKIANLSLHSSYENVEGSIYERLLSIIKM